MPNSKLKLGEEYPSINEETGIREIVYIGKDEIQSIIRNSDKPILREQHPKQFGCVWAEFTVERNLPDYLREGIFKEAVTFPAWIRFSSRKEKFDPKGDVAYGMAIKLMDVSIEKYGHKMLEGEGEAETHDFLLIDFPVFFIRNVEDYLISRNEKNELKKPLKLAFRMNPFKVFGREFWIVAGQLKNRIIKIKSPLEINYWSTVPYRLGQDPIYQPWSTTPHEKCLRAVKFFVKPRLPNNRLRLRISRSENYLREVLNAFLSRKDAYFDFYLQLQTDPQQMPIEDPRISWRGAQECKVATIRIPAQVFNTAEQLDFGEHLSFTPWHCLPEHKPLGGINRARKEAYQCSSMMRHQANQISRKEPTSETSALHKQLIDTPKAQQALTVLVPIKPEVDIEQFKAYLSSQAADIKNRLKQSSPSTHFLRWVVIYDEEPDDSNQKRVRGLKALLFTSNYDGELKPYLEELVKAIGESLNCIWNHCEGYKDGIFKDFEAWCDFIQAYRFKEQVFGVAYPGKTVQIIRNNQQLRRLLDQLLDDFNVQKQIEKLHNLLRKRSPHNSVKDKEKVELADNQSDKYLISLLERLVGIRKGYREPDKNLQVNQRIRMLQAREDRTAQNELTILVPVRPNLRSFFLLWLGLVLTQSRIRQGRSTMLKLKTIHFLRWVILTKQQLGTVNTHYLLFESSYNGSWDGYINDFIRVAGSRMNCVFGNCIEYPPGGAQDKSWFKQHIRNYQFPAQIFYSAYEDLTVREIEVNDEVSNSALDFLGQQTIQSFISGSYNLMS